MSMIGLAQTSSNSVIKLADKVAIFEIKKKTPQTQSKQKKNKLAIYRCKSVSLAES